MSDPVSIPTSDDMKWYEAALFWSCLYQRFNGMFIQSCGAPPEIGETIRNKSLCLKVHLLLRYNHAWLRQQFHTCWPLNFIISVSEQQLAILCPLVVAEYSSRYSFFYMIYPHPWPCRRCIKWDAAGKRSLLWRIPSERCRDDLLWLYFWQCFPSHGFQLFICLKITCRDQYYVFVLAGTNQWDTWTRCKDLLQIVKFLFSKVR